MATPSVSAVGGQVKEKITRERILPASEAARDGAAMPDFWEYVEALTPEKWNDHIVYLYREDPKVSTYSGEFAYLDKFVGYIEVRPGVQAPMEERGLIEQAIKEKFGGRAFRLICKRGKERVTVGKCVNEAPPKYPDANPQQFAGPLPNAGTTDASVASKAIDAMANQQPDAMRLAMDVLRTASEIVMKSGQPHNNPPAAAPVSDIDAELKRAMINRMLNPPDPLAEFAKYKELFQPQQNQLVDKLVGMALEKFMSPAPAVSGRTTLLDLGRDILPSIAGAVKDSIHEYRLATEAQVRGIELQRGMNPSTPMHANPLAPAALPPAVETAAPSVQQPAAPPPGEGSGMPSFPWIEQRIANIAKDLNYTVDEAVDETLSFLYNVDPRIVGLLLDPPTLDPRLKPGEEGLLQLFQHEPILQQVPVGPRLTEYIKKFVIQAKEAEATRAATAKPPAPPPSA